MFIKSLIGTVSWNLCPTQEAMVVPGNPREVPHSASLQSPPHSSPLCQSMRSVAPSSAPTSGAGWFSIHKALPISKCQACNGKSGHSYRVCQNRKGGHHSRAKAYFFGF